FSPDGRLLALAGSGSNVVHVWDPVAAATAAELKIGDTGHATSLSFSKGSKLLSVTTSQGTLQLWDVDESKHSLKISCFFLQFELEARRLVAWEHLTWQDIKTMRSSPKL